MRNDIRGRVSAKDLKMGGKKLVVPVALAVTVIAAACGDDEPKEPPLASCYAVQDSPTCKFCIGQTGLKQCNGQPHFCALTPDGGGCQIVS